MYCDQKHKTGPHPTQRTQIAKYGRNKIIGFEICVYIEFEILLAYLGEIGCDFVKFLDQYPQEEDLRVVAIQVDEVVKLSNTGP